MSTWLRRNVPRWLVAAAWLYLAALFAWFLLYLLMGDGSGYLGLLNSVAIYFFLPLPAAAAVGLLARRKTLLIPIIGAALIFASLWGPLFLPNPSGAAEGPQLRVMSFNVLGRAGPYSPIIDSILAEDADVVFLQEVTPEIAAVISVRLAEAYPYHLLQAAPGSRGLGVLSRYPLERMDVLLRGDWMGSPQILSLDWGGQMVTLVNFHTRPTGTLSPRWVRRTFQNREIDMLALADFASIQSAEGPVIAAGDANVTHLNEAYKHLAAVLQDAWWETGQGLGHTFPGPIEDGLAYARVSLFRVPYWIVRIDHIFYSGQLQAKAAWLAQFDGGSDHRGVVVDFVLVE